MTGATDAIISAAFFGIAVIALDWRYFVNLRSIRNIAEQVRSSDEDHLQESYLRSTNWRIVMPLVLVASTLFGLATVIQQYRIIAFGLAMACFAGLVAYRLKTRKAGSR
jgi:hypothetical protein